MGDYAGLLVIDPTTAYRIANLEFSRSDEQEADAGAVHRLHRAGITHKGLVKFFERIQKDQEGGDGPEWLSTHPATASRIAKLQGVQDVAAPPGICSPRRGTGSQKIPYVASDSGPFMFPIPSAFAPCSVAYEQRRELARAPNHRSNPKRIFTASGSWSFRRRPRTRPSEAWSVCSARPLLGLGAGLPTRARGPRH